MMNVILARTLSHNDYGIFVTLFGGMLALQVCNATLLFHPLAVSLSTESRSERQILIRSILTLTVMLSMILAMGMLGVLLIVNLPALALPSLVCFVVWQFQEAVRRCLLTEFRQQTAVWGDAVSYVGQAAAAAGLALGGGLTLSSTLWCMAVTSFFSLVLQLWQCGIAPGGVALRRTIATCWRLGGAWALGNGVLASLRTQILTWLLVANGGPAAAAAFQAAMNVVNLSNPIMLSLGNIIPQTAARARANGPVAAWHAASGYAVLAIPPLAGFAVAVMLFPGTCLWLLYGGGSGYLTLGFAVRLLVTGTILAFITDFIIAFLHGIVAVPAACRINAIGTVGCLMLAVPLIASLGLVGACLAFLGAHLMRLVAAYLVMTRITGNARQPHREGVTNG